MKRGACLRVVSRGASALGQTARSGVLVVGLRAVAHGHVDAPRGGVVAGRARVERVELDVVADLAGVSASNGVTATGRAGDSRGGRAAGVVDEVGRDLLAERGDVGLASGVVGLL